VAQLGFVTPGLTPGRGFFSDRAKAALPRLKAGVDETLANLVSLFYHAVTMTIADPFLPAAELAAVLASLASEEEARALLRDLCTPAEVRTLAERWQVAKLLDAGQLTYREIHDATGVSTTTIVRVARFLKEEQNGGYRLLLDRMKDTK